MAASFITAPTPLWTPNNRIGLPNIDGYMLAFQNKDRSPKDVYTDATGTTPYSQPISFQAAAQRGPFYWTVNDPALDTDPYYLEIYDKDDNLIQTFENFQPAGEGGAGPVTVNQDFNNFIPNPQFRFFPNLSITPVQTNQEVAHGEWFFVKNNTSATDEIRFDRLALGTSDPTNTPVYEFVYDCTGAGSGESIKYLEIRLRDVRSLEGQQVNFSFEGIKTSGTGDLTLESVQFFGTGGSPSATDILVISTPTLTGVYSKFDVTFIVPSVGGKTLGSNNDDYLSIRFNFPFDAILTYKFTNMQLTLGTAVFEFQYRSTNESVGEVIPPIEPGFKNRALQIGATGLLSWGVEVPVGFTGIWWLDTAPPTGWLNCEGQSLLVATYPELHAVIGYVYGGSGLNFNLPDTRGYFPRGVSGASGRDPDAATRTPVPGGSSNGVGSTQQDEIKSHTHGYQHLAGVGSAAGGDVADQDFNFTTDATGGAETRAKNIYVRFIIKAQ
jgi:microcystin-dependent protein